jgi:hypothetical protein
LSHAFVQASDGLINDQAKDARKNQSGRIFRSHRFLSESAEEGLGLLQRLFLSFQAWA